MRPHILCPCVSLWMYFSICVSLIDGRIKTTSLCGIPNDYIASFCVKKLDGTKAWWELYLWGHLVQSKWFSLWFLGQEVPCSDLELTSELGLLIQEALPHQPWQLWRYRGKGARLGLFRGLLIVTILCYHKIRLPRGTFPLAYPTLLPPSRIWDGSEREWLQPSGTGKENQIYILQDFYS